MFRIGHAKDIHRLEKGRKLILGGIDIPFSLGLLGHSDADVILHVVSESIIGALGLGDLGTWFSDKDPKYKDCNSSLFVVKAVEMMEERGFKVHNIDVTLFAEAPFIQPYKTKIRENIAQLLKVEVSCVNIKATRGEGLGFIGRLEGMVAEAVVLLQELPKLRKL